MLSRVLFGSRITLAVSALAALVTVVVGAAWGAIAGFYGGRIDGAMMRLTDAAMSVPRILLLIAVVAVAQNVSLPGSSCSSASPAGSPRAVSCARRCSSLREQDFTVAARALGARDREILWRHLLPNVASTVIVAGTLALGHVVYLEAALSFLGIGVRPPTPSWGNIIQEGSEQLTALWWMSLFPGLAIVITCLVGERVRRRAARRLRSAPGGRAMTAPLLSVKELRASFAVRGRVARAVDGISFHIAPNETVGLVGESGCGKSVTALSIMRLIRAPGTIDAGSAVEFDGQNLLTLSDAEMRAIRGARLAMVFQEPMTSLNPVFTVGDQVAEVAQVHRGTKKREAWDQAVAMLEQVGLPDPAERARDYPHQLSGGMRQRVMIAMALVLSPALLVADEPTTALDVTIQAQILELISTLQAKRAMSVLLITHDLGVIAERAQRVIVMYAGQIVEEAPVGAIFRTPHHPYTRGLLGAVPRIGARARTPRRDPRVGARRRRVAERLPIPRPVRVRVRSLRVGSAAALPDRPRPHLSLSPRIMTGSRQPTADSPPLLAVSDLTKDFVNRRGPPTRAVHSVSLTIAAGETLGLVGESGCGKTTLGRCILRLIEPTSGAIHFDGRDLRALSANRCAACAARCSSCSRIPMARSIRA